MLWAAVAIVAILILVLALRWIGLSLPETYDGRASMLIDQTPDAIWARINDYRKHPMSGSRSRSMRDLLGENGLPAWIEDLGSTQIRVTTSELRPTRRIVRDLADQVVPMSGHVEITIEPCETGSRVTMANRIVIRAGTFHVPWFRIVMKVTRGAQKMAKEFLGGIAKDFGEPPRFEP